MEDDKATNESSDSPPNPGHLKSFSRYHLKPRKADTKISLISRESNPAKIVHFIYIEQITLERLSSISEVEVKVSLVAFLGLIIGTRCSHRAMQDPFYLLSTQKLDNSANG
jgi:hypothetical protein